MENLLNLPNEAVILVSYDLKGSLKNRITQEDDLLNHAPKKDLNFLKDEPDIDFSNEKEKSDILV